MASRVLGPSVAPTDLRLMLLSYGMRHPYRVLNLDEIAAGVGCRDRDQLKETLDQISWEGLLTRFSGRYCFNRSIPPELKRKVEQMITPSGTLRVSEMG